MLRGKQGRGFLVANMPACLPHPLGKGEGERRCQFPSIPPHPDPLPEGEGTGGRPRAGLAPLPWRPCFR
jgi:hypothetical protein